MSSKYGLRPLVLAASVAVGSLMAVSSAHAVVFNTWTNITNNANTDDVSGQLAVDVTQVGSRVNFRFTNNVGFASSITDIYFDDKNSAVLLSIQSITDSGGGVSFDDPANPSNLPGGNAVNFDADLSADSDPPTQPNGVSSASEYVDILMNLVGGKTFNDVIAELTSGELVLGLHIQGFREGGSDSYINGGNPPPSVPEPATLALFGAGLLGLGLVRRRRSV